MFKLIGHVVVFVIGAGVGVYWGVHNPTQAASLAKVGDVQAARIAQAVAEGKQQVLQQVVADHTAPQPNGQPAAAQASGGGGFNLSKYQQMLQSAKQEVSAAKAQMGQ